MLEPLISGCSQKACNNKTFGHKTDDIKENFDSLSGCLIIVIKITDPEEPPFLNHVTPDPE